MEMLKAICKQIKGEFKSAEEYAKMAIKLKDIDKPGANMYYDIANQELEHAERLKKYCNNRLDEKNDDTHNKIWEWEKEHFNTELQEIKILLDMFK